jgi:hypothetical protein
MTSRGFGDRQKYAGWRQTGKADGPHICVELCDDKEDINIIRIYRAVSWQLYS